MRVQRLQVRPEDCEDRNMPAQIVLLFAALASAADLPRFDVASVRLCSTGLPPNAKAGGGKASPEALDINCQTLKGLIQMAYVIFGDGHRVNRSPTPIAGGTGWMDSDRFDIRAKADGIENQILMHGPMLQALLEDRFRLKLHRETRLVPVYELRTAKGGPRLRRFREGSCAPYDILATFPPPPPPENPCRSFGAMKEGIVTIEAGATLDEFATAFLGSLDRPVINKTGLRGKFDIHLEYVPDEASPDEVAGQTIFGALERQLGLKLSPAKGPGEILVIDSAEKPSAN